MMRKTPCAVGLSRFRITKTRPTRGATSLSNSNHFPPMLLTKVVMPVMLPPGRAKLSTKPLSAGSPTFTNTIGIELVAFRSGTRAAVVIARIASGLIATSSAA